MIKKMNDRQYLEDLGLIKHLEILREAKKFYLSKYGEEVTRIPREMIADPTYLSVLPEELLEMIKLLEIPIDRVDIYWIAKMYCLAPLPMDWRVKHTSFESKSYVYMRKSVIPFHPGLLYFKDLAIEKRNEPMKMKLLRDHSKPNTKIPLHGSYIHVHLSKTKELIKTNIKAVMMNQKRKELGGFFRKEHAFDNNWWKGLGRRPLTHTNPRKGDRSKCRENIFIKGNTCNEQIAYQEKESMKRRLRDWKSAKDLIQEQMIDKLETGFVNSRAIKRAYIPPSKLRAKVGPTSKMSLAEMKKNFHMKKNMARKTQDSFNMFRSSSQQIIRHKPKSVIGYRVGKKNLHIKDSDFDERITTAMSKGFFRNLVSPGSTAYDDQGQLGEQEDEVEDPFKKFDEKNVEETVSNGSAAEEEGHPVDDTVEEKTIKAALKTQSGKEFKAINFSSNSLRKKFYNTPVSKFYKSSANIKTTSDMMRIENFRKSVNFRQFNSQDYNRQKRNLLTYAQKWGREDLIVKNNLISRRVHREKEREYREVKKIKKRLARSNVNQSLSSLRNALMTPEISFIDDPLKMRLPSAGAKLVSLDLGRKKKKRKNKKGKR